MSGRMIYLERARCERLETAAALLGEAEDVLRLLGLERLSRKVRACRGQVALERSRLPGGLHYRRRAA